MIGGVAQADRHRLVDQQPEDPAAARQVADRHVQRGLRAGGEELGQLASGLHHALKEDIEVQLGRQGTADVQQLAQAVGAMRMAIVA